MFKKRFKKPGEFKAAFKSRRRKVCRFCEDKVRHIGFSNDRLLRRFVNERGKIVARRISGNYCNKARPPSGYYAIHE